MQFYIMRGAGVVGLAAVALVSGQVQVGAEEEGMVSNAPALISAPACTGPYDRIIPAAARTKGVGTSWWFGALDLLGLDQAASVDLALLLKNQANPAPQEVNVRLPANDAVRLDNVLGTVFSASNAALGLRFCEGYPFANLRFYNAGSAAGLVYGMLVPAMAPHQAVTACRPGIFHHLTYLSNPTTGQRVNIGFANAVGFDVDVLIRLFGDDDNLIGTLAHTLLPFEHRQFTRIHQSLATPQVSDGWAEVLVLTPGGMVHPYAMLIENFSGDGIYMPVELTPPPGGPVMRLFEGTWSGIWDNVTYSISGPVSMDWSFDPTTQQVTVTVDVDGSAFGGDDPPPETFTGVLGASGLTFSGTSPSFGSFEVTIDGHCTLAGTLTGLPGGSIGRVDLTGTFGEQQITIDYAVVFSSFPGGAQGTLTLARSGS